jgi:hypothetical protein
MSSRHDLRGDPQLKESNPQLIPNISQLFGPLQAYITRPSHGERVHDMIDENIGGMKPMIS